MSRLVSLNPPSSPSASSASSRSWTLRQDIGGTGAANAASLQIVARSLVAIHDWSFLLGPGFIVGVGTGCCWAT